MEKSKFDYEDNYDRLFISCKKENEVIEGSVRLLNMVLDITTENRVANIELFDASKYLQSLNINSGILNNLTEARFILQKVNDGYHIIIILKAGENVVSVPYNIYYPKKQTILTSN